MNETTGTIDRIERLNTSRNGNPRFRIHLTDGEVLETQSDSAVSYSVENFMGRRHRGHGMVFSLTRAGRVWDMRRADGTPEHEPARS